MYWKRYPFKNYLFFSCLKNRKIFSKERKLYLKSFLSDSVGISISTFMLQECYYAPRLTFLLSLIVMRHSPVNCNASSECSAQGQVFHCKRKNQGLSSVQRQVFQCKLGNQGYNFTWDK